MKCVIIEDELPAQKIIKSFLAKIPNTECVASFQTAISAYDFMQNNSVDVVFLDINLPDISGMDFIKTIKNPPKIIITTAYPDYALDSFELDTIVDYLVKPFSFDRFLKAIRKVENQLIAKPKEDDFIFINVDKTLLKIPYDDILYVESDRNYITIVSITKKYVLIDSLKNWATKLPKQFIQVHKSFVVNTRHIQKIQGNYLVIESTDIPIGRSFKSTFLKDFLMK